MLAAVARLVVRRPVWVILAFVVFMALSGVFGGSVVEDLSSGGFEDPDAEATRAAARLEEVFDAGTPNFVLLVDANGGDVDDPQVQQAGMELTERLAGEEGLTQVVSYWALGSPPPLRSEDGSQALVLARVTGTENEQDHAVAQLAPEYTLANDAVTVRVGGSSEVFRQLGETVERDLQRAEAIALPVTMLLLIVVFGSVVSAALPVGMGMLAILGTFGMLKVVTQFTDVSIFALNLTTMLGLGLAIDYSLFTISRYREELHSGVTPQEAATRSILTAGRTVLFSAVTVLISMCALLVFPLAFLRSFAYAGAAVVGISAIAAVVLLPAILVLLGHRVDKLTVRRRKPVPDGKGFWHDLAMRVMRRPALVGTGVVVLLLALGAPFLRVQFGLPDYRVLPEGADAAVTSREIAENFESRESGALPVLAEGLGDPRRQAQEVATYALALSELANVSRVDAFTGTYVDGREVAPADQGSQRFLAEDATYLNVIPAVEPVSPQGEELVKDIRAAPAPFDVLVTGQSAQLVDSKAALFGQLPYAAAIIVLTTFTLLFLMFGSVVVPAKAIVLNTLSLSAMFGAMVWVFQEGHFSDALGFTPTGLLDITSPILMFCIAFGLSMDYEVFLLSRIKEEYDHTGDNTRAVAVGLQRTGGIVTAAAVLLAIVFISFATSGVSFIKLFGIGLTIAVLMDATLIRGTLVPAFMKLAGPANWWAPKFLRRIHERFGVSEHVELPPVDVPPVAPRGIGSA